jgi:hypothetical protein
VISNYINDIPLGDIKISELNNYFNKDDIEDDKKIIIEKNLKFLNDYYILNETNSLIYYYNQYFINKDVLYTISTSTSINALYMDLYMLLRIFKTPSITTNYKKKYYPHNNKNIIIYVGEGHANNYRNFLDRLNFKKKIFLKIEGYEEYYKSIDNYNSESKYKGINMETMDSKLNCLNISNFNVPFFQIDNL